MPRLTANAKTKPKSSLPTKITNSDATMMRRAAANHRSAEEALAAARANMAFVVSEIKLRYQLTETDRLEKDGTITRGRRP